MNLRKRKTQIKYIAPQFSDSDGEDFQSQSESDDQVPDISDDQLPAISDNENNTTCANNMNSIKIWNSNNRKRQNTSSNNKVIFHIGSSQAKKLSTKYSDDNETNGKKIKIELLSDEIIHPIQKSQTEQSEIERDASTQPTTTMEMYNKETAEEHRFNENNVKNAGVLAPTKINICGIFEPINIEDEVLSSYFRRKYPEPKNTPFHCIFCKHDNLRSGVNNYIYSECIKLVNHYMKFHKDIPISEINIKCEYCDMFFYHEHLLSHHLKSRSCPKLEHSNDHTIEFDDTMKECTHCQMIFLSQKRFNKHLIKGDKCCKFQAGSHPKEMGIFDYIKCKFCENNFIDIKLYKTHLIPYKSNTFYRLNYDCDIDNFKCRNVTFTKILRECSSCDETFLHESNLDNHMTKKHEGESGFKCDQCNMYFENASKLKWHMDMNKYFSTCIDLEKCRTIPGKIDSKEMIECPVCKKTYQRKNENRKHPYMKHILRRCQYISTYFEENWKCKKCNKIMFSQSDYDAHITEYKCPFCSELFVRKHLLRIHLQARHRDPKRAKFTCDFDGCNYKAFLKSDLINHYNLRHTEKSTIQCPMCDKTSENKNHIMNHLRVHMHSDLRKTLTCKTCGRTFKNSSSLSRHNIITHIKKERFKCDYCNKDFAQIDTMKRHRRIHLDLKPFQCDICNLWFTQKTAMRCHQKRHYNKDGTLKREIEIKKQANVILSQRLKQQTSTLQQKE